MSNQTGTDMPAGTHEDYRNVWAEVARQFRDGFIVSERGLQAALYTCLVKVLHQKRVVVEPLWHCDGHQMIPDLVVVDADYITDIFEIKFVPHGYLVFEPDLLKLGQYGCSAGETYNTKLDANTGCWDKSLPLHTRCARHFVAVARADAGAVWPESIDEALAKQTGNFMPVHHWYGRVGAGPSANKEWDISFDIGQSTESEGCGYFATERQ